MHVPGGVRDDELAARRREVAVRDIDGDALLPLGTQAVRQQRQVHLVVAPSTTGPLDGRELVLEDALGVEQQSPDEGALAIVHRPRGREAQQVHELAVPLVGHRGH